MVKNKKNYKRAVSFILALLCMASAILAPAVEVNGATSGYVKSLKISTSKVKILSGNSNVITASVRTEGNITPKVQIKISKKDKKIINVKVNKPNKKGVSKLIIKAKTVTTEQTATIKITTKAKTAKQNKITKNIKVTVIPPKLTSSTSVMPSTPTPPATPVVPEQSGSSENSADISNPSDSENSENIQNPDDTENLEDIPNPSDTKTPEDATSPGDTEAPEDATSPGDTEAPEDVTSPGDIEIPEDVPNPGDTEAAEDTTSPGDTEIPEDVPSPGDTEKSEDIEMPEDTEEPGTSQTPTESIPITKINLDQTSVEIETADRLKLTATIAPENATDTEVIFSSQDESIAKVNQNGEVTAIAPGTTVITVSTADKIHTAECIVTVVLMPTDIKASVSKENLLVGELASICASVVPTNATHADIKYSSSNPEIAYVSSLGTIIGISPGDAIITAESENEKKTEIKINVSELYATELFLDKDIIYLNEGDTTSLTASLYPENATTKDVKWSSLNEDIATVNQNGMVRAVSSGSTIIRALLEETDVDMRCRVVVEKDDYSNRVTLEVLDEFKDNAGNVFNNTKLFHETMKIRVGLFRHGEPQSYIPVELSLDETFQYGNAQDYFELSKPYIITDDFGYGYVEIKLKDEYKDCNAISGLFQSYVLNAKDSYSQNTAAITVRFASVELKGITVENNLKKEYKNITPSINAQRTDSGISTITCSNGMATEYVHSQQISYYEEGNDRNEHKVILSANPCLLLPLTRDLVRQDEFEVDLYRDMPEADTLQNSVTKENIYGYLSILPEGAKDLDIQLGTFISENCQKVEIALVDCKTGEVVDSTLLKSTEDMPVSDNVKFETTRNGRYYIVISCITNNRIAEDFSIAEQIPIAKITGNHALSNNEITIKENIEGAVTWDLVSEEMAASYQSFGMTREEVEKYVSSEDRIYLGDTYTYTCRIPIAPYVGNAIIEICNPATRKKTYFAYPTIYQNGTVHLAEPNDSTYAFVISEDEAFNSTGNIVAENNFAVVDSTKTGFSAIKASINIPGIDEINENNSGNLYTYIQWTPIDYIPINE